PQAGEPVREQHDRMGDHTEGHRQLERELVASRERKYGGGKFKSERQRRFLWAQVSQVLALDN
ncbi:MAG: hypothetical protein QOG10_7111, partial [Kribbellaceae bacterium]|nr:hypothetical protein [Kribbellaceae bacterium]